MVDNEDTILHEGPGLPRELQSASDLDSSRGPSCEKQPIDYSWHADAICKSMDASEFYIGRGQKVKQRVVDACMLCPVKDQCLNHALLYEEYGYWAGTNPVQRDSMRKDRGIKIQPVMYDSIEQDRESAYQRLTSSSLSGIINIDQLVGGYYYPDEMSFEEMLYSD